MAGTSPPADPEPPHRDAAREQVMHAPPDHPAGAEQRGRTPARWRAAVAVTAAATMSLSVGAAPASAATGYTVTATIPVSKNPFGVAFDPAAGTVYVVNSFDGAGNGTVSVINAATSTVTATITVSTYPSAVAAAPAAGTVYVANGNGTVSVINAA